MKQKMPRPPLLIVEGAELSGKSFLCSQLYTHLEPIYRTSPHRLDGCIWFNCDVGIFGSRDSAYVIERYVEIAERIADRPILFEKFHITDQVYHDIQENEKIEYTTIEDRLQARSARIILCTVREDVSLIQKRLEDRLRLYPHYRAIAKKPEAYLEQQRRYQYYLSHSKLPALTVDTSELPNEAIIQQALQWMGYESSN